VVGLRSGLVASHGLVDAETALEHVDHARTFQLPPGDLQGVVGEREQPEAVVAESAQCRGDLGMAAGSWKIRSKTGRIASRSSRSR
jgi:hypothetical protein